MLLNFLELLFALVGEILKVKTKGQPSRSLAGILKRK